MTDTTAVEHAIGDLHVAFETSYGVHTAARTLAEASSVLLAELNRRPAAGPEPFWRRFVAQWLWRRPTQGYAAKHYEKTALAIEAVTAPMGDGTVYDPDATVVIDGQIIREAVESR